MLDQTRLQGFQESRDYRASYIASRVRLAIATQIRALRDQFSNTQADFAEKVGKRQPVISRLENPDYGRMSVQTLLDIAEALDVALVVKFVSYDGFFTLLDDNQVSLNALRVEPFLETVKRHEQITRSANVISFGLRKKIANEKIAPSNPAAAKAGRPEPWHDRPLLEQLGKKTGISATA